MYTNLHGLGCVNPTFKQFFFFFPVKTLVVHNLGTKMWIHMVASPTTVYYLINFTNPADNNEYLFVGYELGIFSSLYVISKWY